STPAGTATSGAAFTPTPKLTLVSPNPAQVGDTLTIAGSNLTGATALKLGGAAVSFIVDNPTQLAATVPAAALTGSLVVTTPGERRRRHARHDQRLGSRRDGRRAVQRRLVELGNAGLGAAGEGDRSRRRRDRDDSGGHRLRLDHVHRLVHRHRPAGRRLVARRPDQREQLSRLTAPRTAADGPSSAARNRESPAAEVESGLVAREPAQAVA